MNSLGSVVRLRLKMTDFLDTEIESWVINRINEIYKINKFKLRIVGKGKPSGKNSKKLNYPWVEFVGWVESSQKEYAKASFLFTPNSKNNSS